MDNFGFNSEETIVHGHVLKYGSDQVHAPMMMMMTNVPSSASSPPSGHSSEEYEKSTNNGYLNFISQLLMEEEDEEESGHNILALQATEKSLYEALINHPDTGGDSSDCGSQKLGSQEKNLSLSSSSGGKRIRCDFTEEHKPHTTSNHVADESETMETYILLLCPESGKTSGGPDDLERCKAKKKERQSKGGKKRGTVKKRFVDLRSLLMQSAQAAANFDNRSLKDLLLQIRQHSSPQGDSVERAAQWFVKALEARLAGTGPSLYGMLDSKRISANEMLKAYKMFFKACPFRLMTNMYAATTIWNLVRGRATAAPSSRCSLHVIDFGILNGHQWPCLIQALTLIPGGPPKLRITGIDFPRPGLRSAQKVVETGNDLAKFCERFGVPFVYNAIAQQWDTIQVEDLKIQKDELLVVNSMYRLHHLPYEVETNNSPRDTVLKLIKTMNPDMFIHGVINASYTTPFFVTRFKEAFYHFSSLFDMLEATVPAEDDAQRLLYEEQVLGKQVINAIACEGEERIERPETYKHWHLRIRRSGFRQIPHNQETVKRVSKESMCYHKNFSMEEDVNWILLGWKGRVIHAISCWEPDNMTN